MWEEFRIVFITTPDEETSLKIARALVEERLAACANILPGVRSIYRWKGEICDSAEQLLIVKTSAFLVPPLVERVKELHGYEVPETVALPLVAGNGDYLAWMNEQVRKRK